MIFSQLIQMAEVPLPKAKTLIHHLSTGATAWLLSCGVPACGQCDLRQLVF